VNDHVEIGESCVIGGGSNVFKSLPAGSVVWGSPAKPIRLEKRIQAAIKRLPEMRQQMRDILKMLSAGADD
jgi:UDP-3-O-[3-hydroxymyristoyl] glucosamine N-acyltransferase